MLDRGSGIPVSLAIVYVAVLRGAGGEMVRFDDHGPFTYGKPGFANGFFIAYAPGVLLVK